MYFLYIISHQYVINMLNFYMELFLCWQDWTGLQNEKENVWAVFILDIWRSKDYAVQINNPIILQCRSSGELWIRPWKLVTHDEKYLNLKMQWMCYEFFITKFYKSLSLEILISYIQYSYISWPLFLLCGAV